MRWTWLRGPRRPAGRAGATMLTVVTLTGVLVATVGIGYTASRPLLGDGSLYLSKGHTVAHVNGETGKSDAEVAQQLATGKEELQPVRLPDGRLVIVNKTTGTVTYLDGATLEPDAAKTNRPTSAGEIEPVATASGGYLVDRKRDTVEQITVPGQPAPEPVRIPDGIKTAVPCANSVWVVSDQGEVVEISAGRAVRSVRLGAAPIGITVADGHPVVVLTDGAAYVVDGSEPRSLGNLGIAGSSIVLGAWRGAGRHVLAVDRASGRVAALDPRTGSRLTVQLKVTPGQLGAPVALGGFAYVPDYASPSLWKIDLAKASVAGSFDVPGQRGPFALVVSGDRVWANNQYDRRVLVVDAKGHERYADKGPGTELTDTEGRTGPPGDGRPDGTDPPAPDDGSTPDGPPTGTPAATVTVPPFPRGTPYRQACATLTKLKLRCRPVAAGDEAGLRTGDVIGTDPSAGAQVPEGSRVVVRYVGPLRTPTVLGVPHGDACAQIRAAKLTCVEEVAPDLAPAPEELGRVFAQVPTPNSHIAKGGRVTITYRDTIELPNFVGQSWAEACARLDVKFPATSQPRPPSYRMSCLPISDRVPPSPGQAGQVYAQDPPASTRARISATVTIRYYRGESTPGSVIGTNIFAACAAIQAEGLQCVPVEGRCALGVGPVGAVYAQDPPPGTKLNVGAQVRLTFNGDKCPVPDLRGSNAQAACAAVAAAGFACKQVPILHPSTNVVVGQSPAGGVTSLGAPVEIHFSPWALVNTALGTAYPVGTQDLGLPGARLVYQYTCDAGGTKCRGLPTNMFFSRVTKNMRHPDGTPLIDTDFNGTQYAILMTCGTAPGQRKIWRTWNAGSPRYYHVVASETTPPADGSEELGCVW